MQSKDYQHLRNCPFCNGTDLEKVQYLDLVGWMYWIECKSCDHVRAVSLVDMDDAIKKWNTRPVEDEMYQMLKYLADGVRWGGIQHTDRSLVLEIENLLKKARGGYEEDK